MLLCCGAGPVVAADFVASRRETALAMRAGVVIDPAEISPYQITVEKCEAVTNPPFGRAYGR